MEMEIRFSSSSSSANTICVNHFILNVSVPNRFVMSNDNDNDNDYDYDDDGNDDDDDDD